MSDVVNFPKVSVSNAGTAVDRVNNEMASEGINVANLMAEVQKVLFVAKDIRAQLNSLECPQAPGDKASESERNAYAAAKATYDAQVVDLRSMLDTLNGQVEQISKNIQECLTKLQYLQTQELPAAQRADYAAAEKELRETQEKLDQATKGLMTNGSEIETNGKVAIRGEVRSTQFALQSQPSLKAVVQFLKLSLHDLNSMGAMPLSAGNESTAASFLGKRQSASSGLALDGQGNSASDQALLAGFTSTAQAALQSISKEITATVNSGLGDAARTATSSGTQSRWASFIGQQATGNNIDVGALVQYVLRESYLETTKDLQFYAQKVRFFNELKQNIRDETSRLRGIQADLAPYFKEDGSVDMTALRAADPNLATQIDAALDTAAGGGVNNFSTIPGPNGEVVLATDDPNHPELSRGNFNNWDTAKGVQEKLDTTIKAMEEKLNSVGDDAQLANVDLQNMLQKQQQVLQMVSNISKMMFDTAMSIIRKIG